MSLGNVFICGTISCLLDHVNMGKYVTWNDGDNVQVRINKLFKLTVSPSDLTL